MLNMILDTDVFQYQYIFALALQHNNREFVNHTIVYC
jgi:hypothetical protein